MFDRLKQKQIYLVIIILRNVWHSFVLEALGVRHLIIRYNGFANVVTGESEGRKSHERDSTPKFVGTASGTGPPIRRPRLSFSCSIPSYNDLLYRLAAPLNLANSPSLHLLTPAEQTLCSQLRILPKPYLVIKETLVREYARRGGKLRRREARDLVKIDVNKTSRVWDFLVQAGFLKITPDPPPAATQDISYVYIFYPQLDTNELSKYEWRLPYIAERISIQGGTTSFRPRDSFGQSKRIWCQIPYPISSVVSFKLMSCPLFCFIKSHLYYNTRIHLYPMQPNGLLIL